MRNIAACLLIFCAAAGAGTPKYAPVKGALAVPLSDDNSYLRNTAVQAPDYWALASFYVPQHNGYSCSAASVSMALNALLNARRARGDDEKNIDQVQLAEKAPGVHWKELLSEEGWEGRHGVTLAQLGQASREALAAYGAAGYTVKVSTAAGDAAAGLEAFRRALAGNEKNAGDIMLIHFSQELITGAPGGPYPHVSPVGAYDEKTRRVLIMDVDREWYEPYWAADEQVYRAMAQSTKAFGRGGWVTIRRK